MELVWFSLVAAAIANLVMVAIILLKTRPRQPGRIFVWYIGWIACWTICVAVIEHPLATHRVSVLAARASFFCATFVGISWLWFCQDFPYRHRIYRPVIWGLTLLGLPWLVIAWTRLIIIDLFPLPWREHAQLGLLFPLFSAWIILVALTGITLLAVKLRQTRGIERLQLRYILYGSAAMMVGGALFNLILPGLTHSTQYAGYGPLSSLFVTATATVAIIRYRLMQMAVVIRCGLIYALTIGILYTLYLIIITYTTGIIFLYWQLPWRIFSMLAALIVVFCATFVRARVRAFIDRCFFKTAYDYRQILRNVSQDFASARETPVLVDMLTSVLLRALQPTRVAVYLPNTEGVLTFATSTKAWDLLPGLLPDTDPFLAFALKHDDVLLMEALNVYPTEFQEIGQRMQRWGAYVAVPLVAGTQLCGLVFLSDKRSGDSYTADDAGLLRILSKHAATALDNAYHYETLRRTNIQLEQRVRERTSQLAEANARLEQANASLEAERAYLAAAIDILPLPMLFLTPGDAALRKNKAFTELLAPFSVTDNSLPQLLDPTSHTPIALSAYPEQRALRGEVISAYELLIVMPDGTEVPILAHAGPIMIGDQLLAAVTVLQDITALKAADRAKDQFLAVVSHELKTPLTCILAWAEVARFETDPQIIAKSLSIIKQNALRQRDLLDDLLDMSRIIHNKLHLHLEQTDLWLLATQCVDNFEHLATAQQVRVELRPPATALPIIADDGRMTQVISNLLNNALKFTDCGGTIMVSGQRDGDHAVLTITDTGRGIPPERLHDVFAPFRQVEPIEPTGGLGLGLALVKGITELHHGHVTAFSAGSGQGSAFTVTLPLALALTTDALPEVNEPLRLKDIAVPMR